MVINFIFYYGGFLLYDSSEIDLKIFYLLELNYESSKNLIFFKSHSIIGHLV